MLKKDLVNNTNEIPAKNERKINQIDFYEFSLPSSSEKLTLEIRDMSYLDYFASIFIHYSKDNIQELHLAPLSIDKGDKYDDDAMIRYRDGGTTIYNLNKESGYERICIPANRLQERFEEPAKPYIVTSKKEICYLTFLRTIDDRLDKGEKLEKEEKTKLPDKSLADLEKEKYDRIQKDFNFSELSELFGIKILKSEFKDCWSFIFNKADYQKLKTQLQKNGLKESQIILSNPLSFTATVKLTIPVRTLIAFENVIKNTVDLAQMSMDSFKI